METLLARLRRRAAANRLTSVNGVAYTWDDNPFALLRGLRPLALQRGLCGNLTSDGVRTYTYECAASLKRSGRDAANRLTDVSPSGGLRPGPPSAVSFAYDGLPALVPPWPGG